MLDVLSQVLRDYLPYWLRDDQSWYGYVLPDPPLTHQLRYAYRDDLVVCLELMRPCAQALAGFHPHDRPMASVIVEGECWMSIGKLSATDPGSPPALSPPALLRPKQPYALTAKDDVHQLWSECEVLSVTAFGSRWRQPVPAQRARQDIGWRDFDALFSRFRNFFPW